MGEENSALITPNENNVQLVFKDVPEIRIEIDRDKLTWKDIRTLRKSSEGMSEEASEEVLVALLSRLCGQNVEELPIRVFTEIMLQFRKLSGEMTDQKN